VRPGQVRVDRGGPAEVGLGPIEVVDPAQGVAEVVAGYAVIGFQAQRFAKLRDGLLVPSLGKQHQAEAVGGFRRARLDTQGRAAALGGAIELAERPEGLGQIGVVNRATRVARNGLADLVGGAAVIPLLEGNDANQVQRIWIAGLLRQHGLIKPSGLVEPPLLMMPKAQGQCVVHRYQLTVTVKASLPAVPSSSVTVTTTWYMPGWRYLWCSRNCWSRRVRGCGPVPSP
jgi:hypothetical protein